MRHIKNKTPSRFLSFKARLYLAFSLLAFCGIVAFVVSPYGQATFRAIHQSYDAVVQRAHLVLDQVQVEGHTRTPLADINKALNLTQGTPLFDIDLKDLQQRVLALPWIKTVVVERHLPATLFIRITEKQPIAIWQHNKKYLPLDESGHPIQDSKAALPPLLLVVGPDAPQHTLALIQSLDQFPSIREKVRSAVRVSNRRWNLVLNEVNGLTIKLPETDVIGALNRLNQQIEQGLFKKDLASVDLRQPNRLIVTLKEGKR